MPALASHFPPLCLAWVPDSRGFPQISMYGPTFCKSVFPNKNFIKLEYSIYKISDLLSIFVPLGERTYLEKLYFIFTHVFAFNPYSVGWPSQPLFP